MGDSVSLGASKSVLIIGGGVVGLCSAYYAMRAGHRVTVLERGAPDHDGCSLGNAGMIVPSHFTPLAAPGMVGLGLRMLLRPDGPFSIRPRLDRELLQWIFAFMRAANSKHVERSAPLLRDLHLASKACYEKLADEDGNSFGLVKNGLLMLCKTEAALGHERQTSVQANSLGMSASVVSSTEAARLDPAIRMDIAGGVYYSQDCHLNPRNFIVRLTQTLQKNGVQFVWQANVKELKRARRGVEAVHTSGGVYAADEYVLAGGAWTSGLSRQVGVRLLLQAGKGYSLTLPAPSELPSLCSILAEARVAVTPMDGSLRFAGTMEITGLDKSISARRAGGIVASIPSYLPAFRQEDFKGIPVWAGLRPCSPDGLPYIGRPRGIENLCIAAGHAMMGLSLGPITGQLIADLVSDQKPSVDLALLRPDRYN